MTSSVYHCSHNLHSLFPRRPWLCAVLCALCLSAPTVGWSNGIVDQSKKRQPLNLQQLHVLATFDGKRQTSVFTPTITRPEGAKKVVFVVPVPATPIHYGLLDSGLDRDVERFIRLVRHDKPIVIQKASKTLPKASPRPKAGGSIPLPKAHKAKLVKMVGGKPTRAKVSIERASGFGAPAIAWLKSWYARESLGALDKAIAPAVLDYYKERNWTFLVITYTLTSSVGDQLQPVTISFNTSRVILPLKWSWSQTPYAIRADMIFKAPPRLGAFDQIAKAGWEVASSFGFAYSGPMPKTPLGINLSTFKAEQAPSKVRRAFRPWFKRDDKLYVRTVIASSVEGSKSPRKWTEDWSVPAPESQRLMADTREIPKPKLPPKPNKKLTPKQPTIKTPPKAKTTPNEKLAPKQTSTAGCTSAQNNGAIPKLSLFGLLLGVMGLRARRRRQ